MGEIRSRTDSNAFPSTAWLLQQRSWNPSTNKWNAYYDWYKGSKSPTTMQKAMVDVVTPNFRKLVAMGAIINNPMEKTTTYQLDNFMDIHWLITLRRLTSAYYSSGQEVQGTAPTSWFLGHWDQQPYLALPTLDSSDLIALQSRTVSAAHANINSADVLALTTVLEMGKTVSSIGGILKGVTKILKKANNIAKRTARNKALRYTRQSADAWMEARYGLRPMYYDAMGLYEAIQKPLRKLDRATYRGSNSYTDEVSSTSTLQLVNNGTYANSVQLSRSSRLQINCRAGCLCSVNPETRADALGLYALPQTLWEEVPFSFIVDWFLNLGDVIGSFSPHYGTNVLATWISTLKTETQTVSVSGSNPVYTDTSTYTAAGSFHSCVGGRQTYVRTTYTRSPSPIKPILPSFSLRLSAAKLLDLGIIVKQLYSAATKAKHYSRPSNHRISVLQGKSLDRILV